MASWEELTVEERTGAVLALREMADEYEHRVLMGAEDYLLLRIDELRERADQIDASGP